MNDKVSVILTSYNKPVWLKQAIESVINQTHENWELIIMDDNSSDPDVWTVIESFGKDERIYSHNSFVRKEDRMKTARYATLINTAYQKSLCGCCTGYVTYLTDDDYYLPNRFADMVNVLSQPGVSIAYGNQYLKYGDAEITDERVVTGILDDAYDILDHNSVMHTWRAGKDAGYWDDSPEWWRGADGIFWRKLSRCGYKFHPTNTFTDVHRFHTDSVRHKLLEQGLDDLN